jgi:lipopolysaccharide transport system permease protein
MHSAALDSQTLVLEAGASNRRYYDEIWNYRELLAILAWRDITVRYRQALVGVAWALLRPILTLLVFTVIFGRIAKLPTEGSVPYEVMVYSGMLPWFLFSAVISDASNSLVNNANLIGKIYFPRLVVPLSSVVTALVDFCINLILFVGLLWFFGMIPSWRIVFLPVLVIWAVLAALGPALLMAALNVKYRDFRQIVPFVVQVGLYISPVGYASSIIPEGWRLIYSLNPVVGAIDGFRWCLLGDQVDVYLPGMAVGAVVLILFLFVGLRYFRQTERGFADVL